ncbi:MAG: branched-chain amino acid ABC transporter permease [Actinomycetota bacterium]|nr:branched-chain amino acid ABC transporter permease [Actinomycetota bacterium]
MDQVPVYFLLSLPLVGAFAMFAVGIVVTYQASRVLNLAHGAMAMAPAFILFELSHRGVPLVPAILLSVVSGAAIGIGVERFFVSVLRGQSSTAQTVGTVAVLGSIVAIASKVWGTTPRNGVSLFPEGGVDVGNSVVRYGQIGLIVVAVVSCGLLFALFQLTDLGLAMRAAAQNRRAASLMGVDPDFTARLAWGLAGSLAALGGMLLAAITGLHPYNLALMVLPGFVAALIGGLDRLSGALTGALVVGLAQGMVPAFRLVPGLDVVATQVGAPQLVLALLAFVVMYTRGERLTGSDVRAS